MVVATNIEQGNTQKGVNRAVVEILGESFSRSKQTWLDLPCGEAKFIQFVQENYKDIKFYGADKFATPVFKDFEFFPTTAGEFFHLNKLPQFDGITCISGIMCFDGIDDLFRNFSSHLKQNGTLLLTNDNVMSARDRLNFFLFGRVKRFKLIYKKNEGNWNLVLPQALFMFFQRYDFKNIQVKYVSYYWEDLMFLPLALVLYSIFLPSLLFSRGELSIKERLSLFSFNSLMARHYVIWGNK